MSNKRQHSNTLLDSPIKKSNNTQSSPEHESAVVSNLQALYKHIITNENELNIKCSNVNLSINSMNLNELWSIYHQNLKLLNYYYEFLAISLNSCSNSLISYNSTKQIISTYRIQRRLWVYGIVTFLDVLKNVVSIFIEHDICSSFISYCFNILTSLIDLQNSSMLNSWIYEKIGDLSRMSIALYTSRYIDWKISSEYWYGLAIRLNYGQGKIYYHLATVEQDNLDALLNIGKSVFSKETFVPTKQYMKMVIDNINSKNQFIDLPILEFIKIHKLILNDEETDDSINQFTKNFGKDNNFETGLNFFDKNASNQLLEFDSKLKFWFERSSNFALINILQLVGFGSDLNPFAKSFGLIDSLKERKERKEKKDKKKLRGQDSVVSPTTTYSPTLGSNWNELDWFTQIDNLKPSVLKISMHILTSYINGPLDSSYPHIISYLYFLISIGKTFLKYPESKPFIEFFIQSLIPWNSLIDYLNKLLKLIKTEDRNFWNSVYSKIPAFENQSNLTDEEVLQYFNSNENLLEVWKCWGTLWFDQIFNKLDYESIDQTGIKNYKEFMDPCLNGLKFDPNLKDLRIFRILILSIYIAKNYKFGLIIDNFEFKFERNSSNDFQLAKSTVTARLTNLNLIESISSSNYSNNRSTLPLLQWLKQALTPTNIPLSPSPMKLNQISNYITDNDADFENSTSNSTPSISTSQPTIVFPNNSNSLIPNSSMFSNLITKNTLFVLDTNMWLRHCGKLFKILKSNWSNDSLNFAIPLVAFQELRSLRCSNDSAVADSATRSVITLRQLSSERLIKPMKINGELINDINYIRDFESLNNWLTCMDDIIINSILIRLQILQQKPNDSLRDDGIILITQDKNMRLKAKMKNVLSFNDDWFWKILNELSEDKLND